MATNATVKTLNGKKVQLYRSFTAGTLSTTLYTAPANLTIGYKNTDISVTTTTVDTPIPIQNGTTVFNCSTAFTGSGGGDNTTNNTSVYKEGAGQTDAIAQNMIKNSSSTTATWTKEPTTNVWVGTSYAGYWIYIKDATALAKIVSVELRAGVDSSNYWKKTTLVASLVTGWNWISLGVLNTNTAVGTVTGTLDYAAIIIVTNNATDTFVAGDVVVDLLRQWTLADTLLAYDTSYPVFDYTALTVTRQVTINSALANGFPTNFVGNFNTDTTPLLTDASIITEDSKSSTDEFIYVMVDRMK